MGCIEVSLLMLFNVPAWSLEDAFTVQSHQRDRASKAWWCYGNGGMGIEDRREHSKEENRMDGLRAD